MVVVPVDESGRPDFERLGDGVTFAAADEHILRDVSRPLVTDGRLPDQDDPTELLMEEDALDAAGLEVGDTIDTAVPTFDEVIAYEETGLQGPIPWERIEFTIVGAGRSTNDIVVDEEADLDAIWFTQAFYDDHRDSEAFFGLFVELRPGATEDDLRADIEGLVPDRPIEFQATPRSPTASSERCDPGHRRGGVALLVAVTGLLLIGQAVGRLLRADDLDLPALRAAGVTRRQLVAVALLRTAAIGAMGAVIAVLIAFAALTRLPGRDRPARRAESRVRAESRPLGPRGSGDLAAPPRLGDRPRLDRLPRHGGRSRRRALPDVEHRPSRSPGRSASARGSRDPHGLERGQGRHGRPRLVNARRARRGSGRSRGVDRLRFQPPAHDRRTPSLGLVVGRDGGVRRRNRPRRPHTGGGRPGHRRRVLLADRIELDGESLPAIGLEQLRGDQVLPTIAEGRIPEDDEVALGSRTLERLDVGIGDEVTARSPTGTERELTVVGQAVFPGLGTYPGGDRTELGAGVLTTVATLEDLGEGFGFPFLVLNVRPEADAEDVGQGVLDRVGGEENVELTAETDPQRPGDVDSLADVTWVPALLAGILAFMAVVALAHAHHVGAAAPARSRSPRPSASAAGRWAPPCAGRQR